VNARAILIAAWRESRGARGRLAFFVACLALGVAAVVGVAALVDAVRGGIRAQARELLGADLVVSSYRALPEELEARHAAAGIERERTDLRELATMATSSRNGRSQLVEIKAVAGRFPLRGAVVLEPDRPLAELLTPETCVVAPELLSAWELAPGDAISIGGASYTIAGQVLDEPGRLGIAFTSGPRVFLTLEGLARAGLEGFGSRVRQRALFAYADESALPGGDVEAWARTLERSLSDGDFLRFESYREAQPTVRRAMQRVERYLGLVALLSLILGGVGVAMIVRAWIADRTEAVAVLRCLGYRPREVLALYAGNVVLLAGVASVLGGALGSLLPLVVARWAGELLPSGIELGWRAQPIARGLALGVGIALVFSLPPLLAIWRVAPARVLRQEAEPLPVPRTARWSAIALLAGGLFAACVRAERVARGRRRVHRGAGGARGPARGLRVRADAPRRAAAARAPEPLPRPRRRRAGSAGRGRPRRGDRARLRRARRARDGARRARALPQAVRHAARGRADDVLPRRAARSMGSGRARARRALRDDRDRRARRHRAPDVDRRARDRALPRARRRRRRPRPLGVDARAAHHLARRAAVEQPRRRRRAVERPAASEMSVEERYAEDIGVHLGSKLVFDVQGVPREFTVTSLRSVEWESFQINFFLVAEPGALDAAPHMLLGAAHVDADAENALQDELARAAPNVTMLRMRAILAKVRAVLDRLGVAVRVLGLFTVVTGLVVLAGVASSTALRRGREVALLKTLGVTRWGVAGLFVAEFALLGLIAGLVGAGGAFALAWAFLDRWLALGTDLPGWWLPLAALATAALAAASGVAATARALRTRPIQSLRAG
jgi:putative ABC transport system permease protein